MACAAFLDGAVLFAGLANLALAGLCFAVCETHPDLALRGAYVAYLVWLVVALWSWYRVTGRVFDGYTLPATALRVVSLIRAPVTGVPAGTTNFR